MKTVLTFILATISFTGISQVGKTSRENQRFKDYSGTYQLGPFKNGRSGKLKLLQDRSGNTLFYIYLDRGKPSEHEGQLYGQFTIKSGRGTFTVHCDGTQMNCQWSLSFSDSTLVITTIKEQNECGFGYGVAADGVYKRYSVIRPEYFVDESKHKIYFKKTSPKAYNTCSQH